MLQSLWPLLRRFATRLLGNAADGDDAAQHALLKIFSKVREYDRARPTRPWVMAIAHNECRTVRKQHLRRREVGSEPAAQFVEPRPSPEQGHILRDLLRDSANIIVGSRMSHQHSDKEHGSEHDHDHRPSRSVAAQNKGRLVIVLALTTTYMFAEVVAGLWTGSLALLADAGHMLTDAAGVGLALLAVWFGERPPTPQRTYGFHRAEILAALANAVVLLVLSGFVLVEAYRRFRTPPAVQGGPVLLVAALGLVVNVAGLLVMRSGSRESLNLKGAYFELLSDALSSIGVIIAAVVMWRTGWYYADPLISAAIGLFIVPRTWRLLKEAVHILLEGVPPGIDLEEVRKTLSLVPGVVAVHDLHVWALTSGMNSASLHAVLSDGADFETVSRALRAQARATFDIEHITVQIERAGCAPDETHK